MTEYAPASARKALKARPAAPASAVAAAFAPASASTIASVPAASARARVTQRSVAEAAGVHNTTVSLALRNSPAIPEATRERIQAIAARLGYRPDPTLQALVRYRKGLVREGQAQPVAFVTEGATRQGWRECAALVQWHEGAARRGLELGYRLEHFWLGEPGMNERRLAAVLYARGIPGVLLARCAGGETGAGAGAGGFAFPEQAVVRIDPLPDQLALHAVAPDRAGAVRVALGRAVAAGYRRPALALPRSLEEGEREEVCASYLAGLRAHPDLPALPCLLHGAAGVLGTAGALLEWLRVQQPDVVLGFHGAVAGVFDDACVRIPGDVAFVDLGGEGTPPAIAGTRPDHAGVGMVAMDLLAAQLQRFARGVPRSATTTLVGSLWQEGASLLSVRAASVLDEVDVFPAA